MVDGDIEILQTVAQGRFGQATVERDKHRLVIFVAIVVEHDQDFTQGWENNKRRAVHQRGILKGKLGW